MSVRQKAQDLLHKWLNESKLHVIKKGMLEELEAFVNNILSEKELEGVSKKMMAQKPQVEDAHSSMSAGMSEVVENAEEKD